MAHDLFFLAGFLMMAISLLVGSWYLERTIYSKFLVVVIVLAISTMIWFHTTAVAVEGNN